MTIPITITSIILIVLIIIHIRYLMARRFTLKMVRICHGWDKSYVAHRFDEHDDVHLVHKIITDEDYMFTEEWSAVYYLMNKGPKTMNIALNFKPLTIKHQYGEEFFNRITTYLSNDEIIRYSTRRKKK